MLQIEIIAHCWRYPRLLTWHLGAIAAYPPDDCHVTATVCYTVSDRPTCDMLAYFAPIIAAIPTARLTPLALPEPQLMRRAIGRNLAAMDSRADVVLFADVDYLFGAGALDAIAAKAPEAFSAGFRLLYPASINESLSHDFGDADIAAIDVESPNIPAINPSRFHRVAFNRAIGGAQWVSGDTARLGYLPASKKFQRPADRWMRTYEDVPYRRQFGDSSKPIPVPNVYRIMHGQRGRFNIGVEL